jgi:signal transduction histidine kinase
MSRDLHDVIGHSMSVISLHADVAREAIGSDDEQARQALAHIRRPALQLCAICAPR